MAIPNIQSLVPTPARNALHNIRDLVLTRTPLILENGIAATTFGALNFNKYINLSGLAGVDKWMPIIILTEPLSAVRNLFAGKLPLLSDYAYSVAFRLVEGAQIYVSELAMYPMKNLGVAANSIIETPTEFSVDLIFELKDPAALIVRPIYELYLHRMLLTHVRLGGTFSFITHGLVFTNAVLVSIVDASSSQGETAPLSIWRLRFIKPIVTELEIKNRLNNFISNLNAGSYQ